MNRLRSRVRSCVLFLVLVSMFSVQSFSVQNSRFDALARPQHHFALASSSWDPDGEAVSDSEVDEERTSNLDNMERTWRFAKKPLLRIGSKGATLTHGNSLRQLLDDHTVVKVKINTGKFGSLQDAYRVLRDLAEESGANKGMELLQAREGDKVILFGLAGTLQRIEEGEFPPKEEEKSSTLENTD